ncbi:MAG: TRAP transporter large permease subunit [Oscillospiraceae bacterium]
MPPEFAGAVEAASSTGGQIMPPHHGRCGVHHGGNDRL